MKKTVKVSLGKIGSAADIIEKYRNKGEAKIDEYLRKIAELGAYEAQVLYYNAIYAGTNDVRVTVEKADNGYKVVASGHAVAFIEFGSGITYTEVKKLPERSNIPKSVTKHGTYGQGKGGRLVQYGPRVGKPSRWVYMGEPGNGDAKPARSHNGEIKEGFYSTLGNPPAMAMITASEEMRTKLSELAKEVFE